MVLFCFFFFKKKATASEFENIVFAHCAGDQGFEHTLEYGQIYLFCTNCPRVPSQPVPLHEFHDVRNYDDAS